MALSEWLPTYQHWIEDAIVDFFDTRYTQTHDIEKTYESALRYAVEWGGKRLRPILAMLSYEYSRGVSREFWLTDDGKKVLNSLIGIELIHCFTLVHDDLPSMDNDELRRGKPTVWKTYGEAMALLVGDTLQTIGFELIARSGSASAVTEVARALGDLGVARWQVRDTFLRHDSLTEEELLRIHDEKTGIFISASLVIGAILGWLHKEWVNTLRRFGMLLGRVFQVQDDILDATGDTTTLGKKTGKDIGLGKGIVALIGLKSSIALRTSLEEDIRQLLAEIPDTRFDDIVTYVTHRTV